MEPLKVQRGRGMPLVNASFVERLFSAVPGFSHSKLLRPLDQVRVIGDKDLVDSPRHPDAHLGARGGILHAREGRLQALQQGQPLG